MTNKELIKALESYPDNAKVRFTLVCDNDFRKIDNIRFNEVNNIIILESYDVPDEDDLKFMAEATLEHKRDTISKESEKLLEEFVL